MRILHSGALAFHFFKHRRVFALAARVGLEQPLHGANGLPQLDHVFQLLSEEQSKLTIHCQQRLQLRLELRLQSRIDLRLDQRFELRVESRAFASVCIFRRRRSSGSHRGWNFCPSFLPIPFSSPDLSSPDPSSPESPLLPNPGPTASRNQPLDRCSRLSLCFSLCLRPSFWVRLPFHDSPYTSMLTKGQVSAFVR